MFELAQKIDRILTDLSSLASQVPSQSWIPFFVNGIRCGDIERENAEMLAENFRFLSLSPKGLDFQGEAPKQISFRMAALSYTLKQMGLVQAWRDEPLPVVPLGQLFPEPSLGIIERAVCRPLALTTYAVHLNPFTEDGRLWVAQRSFKKAIGPGYWDNCAAGIVPYGETFDRGMEREAFEEAGIVPGTFVYTQVNRHLINRPVTQGWMRENTVVYTASVPSEFVPCNMDGEVEQFALLDPETIVEMIEKRQFTFESALSTLIALRSRL